MADRSDKSAEMDEVLDDLSSNFFGRSRMESIQNDRCVFCGEPANDFRNELSRREFSISGMCQACQDDMFGED